MSNLIFADKSISHYQQYIRDGEIDVDALLNVEKLNDAQVEALKPMLVQAGYVRAGDEVVMVDGVAIPKSELVKLEPGKTFSVQPPIRIPELPDGEE